MERDTNVTNDPTPLADRLRTLLDYLEPVDAPDPEEMTILAKIADALTVSDIEVLGQYIEGVRIHALHRGRDDTFARLEEVVQEDFREIRAQAERYVEREDGAE